MSRFRSLFDNPVFGEHSQLVLGWSDEQLRSIADRLAMSLPDNLTAGMTLAIAGIARSIVTEEKITGNGVHFARGKDAYRIPKRYRDDDPRNTWHYTTRAMDILENVGLIEQARGLWCQNSRGYQSVAWATGALVALVGPLLDVSEHRRVSLRTETIVLRNRLDKAVVDYQETAETTHMREQVSVVNEGLSRLDLRQFGKRIEIPIGRRIFNGSFSRGGRFYCHGASFQGMRARDRLDLQSWIDGVAHPIVEIDYAALHITMAYAKAGAVLPQGDLYEIEGFDRQAVKLAVNVMFNATSRKSAVLAIAKDLNDRTIRVTTGCADSYWPVVNTTLAKSLVEAVERKHHRIKQFFSSDCGARFQRVDSDMAMQVMIRMIERTGRCPLPVHDSFLVADVDCGELYRTMSAVATEHRLHLNLKESRQLTTTIDDLIAVHSPLVRPDIQTPEPESQSTLCPNPQPFPLLLEVTTAELQGSIPPKGPIRLDHATDGPGRNSPATWVGPRSAVRKPNWHDPPRFGRRDRSIYTSRVSGTKVRLLRPFNRHTLGSEAGPAPGRFDDHFHPKGI